MKMNRIAFMLTIILAIFVVLPSHFVWLIAKAGESPTITDGVYQVELSFLSLEAVEHEGLFSEKAMLTVAKGQYTLSVPMKYENLLTAVTVKQQVGSIPFRIDKAENLVQFDVKNLQQAIVMEGVIEKPLEEISTPFSEQITIHTKGLPPIEEILPPPIIEPSEKEEPSKPIVEEKVKETFIDYVLLVDGTDAPSIMNTYVDPLLKIIKKDNKYYAQMKILKSSWLTGLTVEQQGKMIVPKTISLIDNHRLIQFEVENFEKMVRLWVQVDIPELTYHHQYYVQLQLDEEQFLTFSGETLKPGTAKPEATKPETTKQNKTPDKGIQKPLPKPIQKPVQQEAIPKPEKYLSEKMTKPTILSPEEILVFDRTLDEAIEHEDEAAEQETNEVEEVKQDASNDTIQLAPLDKMKIGLLVTVCILSGILLVRRIKKAKKSSVDE